MAVQQIADGYFKITHEGDVYEASRRHTGLWQILNEALTHVLPDTRLYPILAKELEAFFWKDKGT